MSTNYEVSTADFLQQPTTFLEDVDRAREMAHVEADIRDYEGIGDLGNDIGAQMILTNRVEDEVDASFERDTDTTPADNQQLAGIFAALSQPHVYTDETLALIRQAEADIAAEQGDPQWAGPSLPHPSEATSDEEADELRQGWDDWQHGIEPNQEQLEA